MTDKITISTFVPTFILRSGEIVQIPDPQEPGWRKYTIDGDDMMPWWDGTEWEADRDWGWFCDRDGLICGLSVKDMTFMHGHFRFQSESQIAWLNDPANRGVFDKLNPPLSQNRERWASKLLKMVEWVREVEK